MDDPDVAWHDVEQMAEHDGEVFSSDWWLLVASALLDLRAQVHELRRQLDYERRFGRWDSWVDFTEFGTERAITVPRERVDAVSGHPHTQYAIVHLYGGTTVEVAHNAAYVAKVLKDEGSDG